MKTPYYNFKNKVLKSFRIFLVHKGEIVVRGFTLIELLVVIAILAVLATATVLVLNPAELLKQGRDSTRISDLSALNSAISLWVADVLNTTGNWSTVNNCTAGTTKPGSASTSSCAYVSSTVTSGTGWVNLNFGLIAAGSPLSKLPLDPNNSSVNCSLGIPALCQYAWAASSTVGIYEIDAQMESTKFKTSGSAHVTDNDGGSDNAWYEVGSNLTLF